MILNSSFKMSKDRKKLVHIHSNVNDKQPTPTTLELGELGVNNAAGNAFISTKNSNNEVVRFSEDGTIVNWMEYKEVIPYEAYVRGSNTATTDVTTDDLANNKSNIVIKLNQVVARNTEYDEKVNGAKDIYGNEINPISADGYKDGAGLAIDMSRYAMIGANPSFSSVTTTCGANLQGKTSVKGSTCGSELDVNVSTIKENATTIDTTACTRNYNNTNDFKVVECTEGQGETQIKSCKKFNVKSNDIVLEQCGSDGETRIKSCSAVTIESKNITLTDGDCENGQVTIETNDICLAGNEKINVYGANTNIGLDCDDSSISTNSRVFGKGTLITSKEISDTYPVQNNIEIVAAQDIKEDADRDITIHANNILCESGKTVSVFAGEGGKLTIGGNSCEGNTDGTYPITYVRRPKTGTCDIHATTIDGALDEVYNRSRISLTSTAHTTEESSYTEYTLHQDTGTCDASINFTVNDTIVSMTAEPYPASSEMLKKYTFWQYVGGEKKDIGVIDIPKDHILKDVSVVWGTLNENTFTPCTQASENCHWYIKLVWNVFDPSTSHPDDKVTYLPADDFIKDINEDNSNTDRGANVDVWYDGKQNWVSATTKVTIKNADGTSTKEFSRDNGFHSLNSYTLNCVSGDVKTASAATNWTYDPFDKKVTITAATDASHINRQTVSWSYGDVKTAAGNTYDPGAGTVNTMTNRTMSFVIPQSVDNINRGNLTVTHNGFTDTFDPASDSTWSLPHSSLTISYGSTCALTETGVTYDTSAVKSIVVPKTISDVTGGKIEADCDSGCVSVNGDVCVDGVVKANALYSTSDKNLKENIKAITYEDYHKVSSISLKSFNFKDDETKTKTYGVIAQDLQAVGLDNIVHKDENNNLSVDYISLLILKIADLENTIKNLSEEIKNLKGVEDKNK